MAMKKLLYLFCASLLVLTSCSNGDDKEDSVINNSVLVKKAIMKDGTSSDFFEYSYNANKLTRISPSFTKNAFIDFTYNGDLINGSKRYDENKALLFEMIYEYDGKQRLISEKLLSKFYDSVNKRIFVYNSDGTIGYTEFTGDLINQDQIVKTGKIWVNDEGETIKVEEYEGNELLSKAEYTYDDKNNIYKNILGYYKLFLLGEIPKTHNILTCKKYDSNNVLTYSYSNKYSYNSDNYPVSVITTYKDGHLGNTEWVYY
jgi:hypothetical protein